MIIGALANPTDVLIAKVCLETVENVLDEAKEYFGLHDDDKNPYILRLAQCDGFNVIEKLQFHEDNEVYNLVDRLIKKHFECEEYM